MNPAFSNLSAAVLPVEKALRKRRYSLLFPLFGSFLFVLCYVVATLFYPGGSQAGPGTGFSWSQNYWCNLLAEQSVNGAVNPARPVAIMGMVVLVISITGFWFIFSRNATSNKNRRWVIETTGTASMLTVSFLSSTYHDAVINISAGFGLIAVGCIMKTLFDLGWNKLLYLGLAIPLLIGLNNLLYYGEGLIVYLPVVQKISFLYFLFWICLVTLKIYHVRTVKSSATLKKILTHDP